MIETIKDNDLSKIYPNAAVVFSASWCESCHDLLRLLEPISGSFNAKLYNVDVDNNEKLSEEFGIKSLPCVVLFKNGKEHTRYGNNVYLNEIVHGIRSM